MARIDRFEDIQAWRDARTFVKEVYPFCRNIESKRDYSLADQMKRASVSIMANIAEGFAKKSPKEFGHYLFIAKASAAEVQSHLYVALDQAYLSQSEFSTLFTQLETIQKRLSNFIKYLKTCPPPKTQQTQQTQ